jgi:hypothetical protein
VLLEDSYVIQQIQSIYSAHDSDTEKLETAESSQKSELIDIFKILVLANEKFLMIDKAVLWNYDAAGPSSPSSTSMEEQLNAKDQMFISLLYQDYCCLYLELLSTALASFYHEKEQRFNESSSLSLLSIQVNFLKRYLCEQTTFLNDCIAVIGGYDFIQRKKKGIKLTEYQKEFIKLFLQFLSLLIYQNPFVLVRNTLFRSFVSLLFRLFCSRCCIPIKVFFMFPLLIAPQMLNYH